MPASQTSRGRLRRRLPLALALVAAIVLAVAGTTWSAAGAPPTTPVRISLDSVTSDVTAPGGTPSGAVPSVLVQIGGTVHLGVSFFDASGAPASFSKDTTLVVTSNKPGLTQLTGTALKGATSATLDVSFTQAANQVSLTVSVPGRAGTGITPGTSSPGQIFDVVSQLQFANSAPNTSFQKGIGGDNSECANATSTNPVCGVVILPHGAQSSQVLLSLGLCDTTYAGCGSTRGALVQTLADLSGLYTRTDPATLLIKCDKTLCAGGAIQNQHLSFSLNGNDALQEAPPCPAKATVGPAQTACVDYVLSHRDNSGDTLLYLQFPDDMRGSVR